MRALCRLIPFLVAILLAVTPTVTTATHKPAGARDLPGKPAVFVFRGGTGADGRNSFAFDREKHWGGAPLGADTTCEGLISQTVGVLDERGKPVTDPKVFTDEQLIKVGTRVVGFKSADGQYRAFNLEAISLTKALGMELGKLPKDSFYSCGHGGEGTIQLDNSGKRFKVTIVNVQVGNQVKQSVKLEAAAPDYGYQGFGTNIDGFRNGTNVFEPTPGYLQNLSVPPYGLLALAKVDNLPLEAASLHHCFSAFDPPDRLGNNNQPLPEGVTHSVTKTLEVKKVRVSTGPGKAEDRPIFKTVDGHQKVAFTGTSFSFDVDPGITFKDQDERDRIDRIKREVQDQLKDRKAGDQKVLGILSQSTFPQQYQRAQTLMDDTIRQEKFDKAEDAKAFQDKFLGKVLFHISYADFGETDPGGAAQNGGANCATVARYANAHAELELTGPFGRETVTLSGPTEIHLDPTTLGDPDHEGLEGIDALIADLRLSGTSSKLGPLTLRLRDPLKSPGQRSTGRVREDAPVKAGRLDVAPFCDPVAETSCDDATARSRFALFLELVAPSAPTGPLLLHNSQPKGLEATLSNQLPSAGDSYEGPDPVALLDESGRPTGIDLGALSFTPSAPVSISGSANHMGEAVQPSTNPSSKVAMSGKFLFAGPVDLGTATLTVERLLEEPGGTGELVKGVGGVEILPLVLAPLAGGKRTAAIFETPAGTIPKVRVEVKTRKRDLYEWALRVERGAIPAVPQLCTGAPTPVTGLVTSFTIDDGVNGAVSVEALAGWRCLDPLAGDPTKPRSLRTP